jgi:hypothetical protein
VGLAIGSGGIGGFKETFFFIHDCNSTTTMRKMRLELYVERDGKRKAEEDEHKICHWLLLLLTAEEPNI